MAQMSVVRKSQLEGATRLDAEYYQPKYIQWAKHIEDIGYSELRAIGKIAYGTTPTGGVFQESGIPFMRSQNFELLSVDIPSLAYCSDGFHRQNMKSVVKPGDVLLAAVGATIGQVAIAPWDLGEANINQNIARVHITSDDFLPAYVAVFLSTYLGQFQINRLVTGNAQQYLNSHQIGQLRIPKLPLERQAEQERLLQEVRQRLKDSDTLYLQAEQLLLDELGFRDLDLSHQLYWTVPFKKTKEANHLDAEHFQPKYEHALTLLGQSGFQVKDVAKVRKDPFKARAGQPFNYIEIGNVHSNGLADSERVLGEDAPSRATWVVHTNDVITSTVRPIRRLSALIGEEQEGYVCSSGFVVFQATGIHPEVFLVFLRLPIVCEILDLKTKASMYPAISTDDLLELPIAVPPKRLSQHIVQLIGDGHRARRKARQLLEEAKKKVENLIEGRA